LSVVALKQIDEIAARAKALIDHNRALLNAFLDTREDLECVRPPFGTVMFPRLRSGETTTRLCNLLRDKYETTVVPGRFFQRSTHFRVGIAGDTDVLEAGLERLGRALDDLALPEKFS
jgi:aspartate/methionine/tyrosine aminotransferase